jgi:hypothetical protein
MVHGGRHPLLSHNCDPQIDTLGRARQMWAERYILVSEGNAGVEAGRDWTLEETWRRMLRLKTIDAVRTTGARKTGNRAVTGVLAVGLLMAGAVQGWAQGTVSSSTQPTRPIATSKIATAAPVTYDNKYEIYLGINFMNFMAGQHLPKRMNLGGGEALFTYWLPSEHRFLRNLGVGAQYRGEAGTTPVFAQAEGLPYNLGRPLVYMNMGMLGAQYRGPKNQFVALNYHGYAGVSHGTFDDDLRQGQPPQPTFSQVTGLYTNRTKPIAALGGSIDFNLSKKMAVRLSPDLILEHFGSEWREFVGVSGGVIYRFGKNK